MSLPREGKRLTFYPGKQDISGQNEPLSSIASGQEVKHTAVNDLLTASCKVIAVWGLADAVFLPMSLALQECQFTELAAFSCDSYAHLVALPSGLREASSLFLTLV